jgi:hypothetical protein
MNARKQISIEQLFRMYPQLKLETNEDAGQTGDKRCVNDAPGGHVPGGPAREHRMEV